MILSLLSSVASASEVARVLIVEPGAFVQLDGDETQLAALDRLDENATLTTNDTGILVLQLHNDHLVRIESDLELPVGKLAMLNSPRSTRTVSEQLEALLYPDERERLGPMVASAEGIGGWHGRLTAAQAPPVNDGAGSGDGEEAEEEALTRGTPRPAASVPAAEVSRGFSVGGGEDGFAEPGQGPTDWTSAAARFQPGADGHGCIDAWSEQLAIHLLTDGVTLTPVVRDGKVARLKVDGAYPIPVCLRDALIGQPASEGAEAVTIRLK